MATSEKNFIPEISGNFDQRLPAKDILGLISRELVEEFRAFVFGKESNLIKIAAVDPANPALQRFVRNRFGDNTRWFLAKEEDVVFILKNYENDFKNEISRLAASQTRDTQNIIKIVDLIINYALTKKASDIHIEPLRSETAVRFRVDGVLHTMLLLPHDIHPAIITRLKIMSNLKIDESRQPQDGRIEPEKLIGISLRISIIPSLYGEKIALRVLDDSKKDISIKSLGFSEEQKDIIARNIEKPFGMIIASGPTGSGKTTTLYGLLELLKKESINISTLEDPIEYSLSGVTQIQINPRAKLTFATGLKSILRQDPDIIMVGEIRDSETAVMASDAALTGHLVITTVHTNDAPSVFPRFLEMKVEDFAVASTTNLVIGQRLVRRICDKCGQEKVLDKVVLKKLKERTDIINKLKELGISFEQLSKRPFRIGKGCPACLNTGYLGRIGLFELLEPDKEIHDLILQHVSAEEIKSAAGKIGFKDIVDDGIAKVLSGITTFDEVLRTTKNAYRD